MTVLSSPFAEPETVTVDADLDDDVDYLLDLDDDEFAAVVFDNIGRDAPANMWKALLDPDAVVRTRKALAAKITSVNQQLAERGPRSLTADEYQDWRRRAAGYITMLGRRQHQAGVAAKEAGLDEPERRKLSEIEKVREHADRMHAERYMTHRVLRDLARAVNAHRLACIDADLAPEPHDVAMWSALDDLRLSGDGVEGDGPSLAEMLLTGPWSGNTDVIAAAGLAAVNEGVQ